MTDDPLEVMARGIYACELARDESANSLIIRLRGGPGENDASYRIEAYEENPESWRDYARAALSAASSAGFVLVPVEAIEPFLPCAPNLNQHGRAAAQELWFKALATLPDERKLVWEEGGLYEWQVTMGDLRRLRSALLKAQAGGVEGADTASARAVEDEQT